MTSSLLRNNSPPDRTSRAKKPVTIGELQLGVLNAESEEARARRADTLALARAADPIPISEAVMTSWARLVADCKAAGVHRTIRLTDALIAESLRRGKAAQREARRRLAEDAGEQAASHPPSAILARPSSEARLKHVQPTPPDHRGGAQNEGE